MNHCDTVHKEITMSHWNIAAAQYRPKHHCVDDHVAHHLRFIYAASLHQCNLLLFPELSLTGPAEHNAALPAPPDTRQLTPLLDAAHGCNLSVIAGITVEEKGVRRRGLAYFTPNKPQVMIYPHGTGACVENGNSSLTIVDLHTDQPNITPDATLFTHNLAVNECDWFSSLDQFQQFAHRYAIPVLVANGDGGSALWDAGGQLIVRADGGELLLTGRFAEQGWQGEIIPLR